MERPSVDEIECEQDYDYDSPQVTHNASSVRSLTICETVIKESDDLDIL